MNQAQADTAEAYRLIDVTSEGDWRDYHRIRRTVLWEARERPGYDEMHPDDRLSSNHPLLLTLNQCPIGTIRLDDAGETTGIVRLVAIVPERQRQGHGRVLSRMVETYAARLRLTRLNVNAASDAVGFYVKMGWTACSWSEADRQASLAGSVQLSKRLYPGLHRSAVRQETATARPGGPTRS